MAPDIFFIAISMITIGAGLAVFLSRRLLHSVIALTFAFIGSALVFIYLGQTFVALLQLFVFVGGLSTYLIVAVASEAAKENFSYVRFVPMLAMIILGLSTLLAVSGYYPGRVASSFVAMSASAISRYYPVLFMLGLLLFSTVIGSILVMKRFLKLVV